MKSRLLFALVFLLTNVGSTFAAAKLSEDPRVHIVSPVEGQQFAPGDKVSVVVEIAPSLHATDGSVGLGGLGSLKGTGFPGMRFNASFVIPDYYASGTVLGPKVTIKVRPLTPPKQLIPVNRNRSLSPTQKDPIHLYIKGLYANGLERNLSSSEAGTTFMSSNPAVLTVDRGGRCTVVGTGLAVVTIENGGVREFVMFSVDDPAHPIPPIDVTDRVAIRRDKLRVDPNPLIVYNIFQRVTIMNTTALPLIGPLFLAVTGLPKGVIPLGGDTTPLELPDEGLKLLPGQSVAVELTLLNQGEAPIEYVPKVYHGRVP
jgi:hypothetical protein